MKLTPILTLALLFLFSTLSFGQLKVVIMGSSTAYGAGASTYANSWAGRTQSYLNRNASDGRDTVVYNISWPAYDSYQEMPTDFIPPAGRPTPDVDYNVTKALSYFPDVVIINLPSNDVSFGYLKSETMFNFRLMSQRIFAAGARCYITTSQPRNDFTTAERDSLFAMVDSVNQAFGPFAIDFWNCLVTTDGLYGLRNEYRASGTPNHVNDLGHEELFLKVINTVIDFRGTVALQLTQFQAQLQNNNVLIKWHTEQQDPNTTFEVQRSVNGRSFETINSQTIAEARASFNYSIIDQTALTGITYYRLKITEGSRQTYSTTVNVNVPGKPFGISGLTTTGNGSRLEADINIQKSETVNIIVMNSSGAILSRQKEFVNQPGTRIFIPVNNLAAGQYYLRVVTGSGASLVKAFIK